VRTEDFKHGVVSILLVLGLVLSIILIAPLASPGDLISDPGGTTIEVAAGDTVLIRHVLEWDEPEDGAYTVTMAWDSYDNHENENFTFVGASAYFTTGDYVSESISAVVIWDSVPSPDYPGSTRHALSVKCLVDNKDNRNGQFNVDIWMGAYGAGGVPHILTDNHPIPFQFGGILIFEGTTYFRDRDPITIKVIPGTAVFSLVNLYTVNVEKILDLNLGSKLVVKFYTYVDGYENENVVETFSPPAHVEENEEARHPESIGVKKARLDLTTNDTEDVISTIASFTVCKDMLEVRFTEIPLEWALAPPPDRIWDEIEFSQIPLYWALAPSC